MFQIFLRVRSTLPYFHFLCFSAVGCNASFNARLLLSLGLEASPFSSHHLPHPFDISLPSLFFLLSSEMPLTRFSGIEDTDSRPPSSGPSIEYRRFSELPTSPTRPEGFSREVSIFSWLDAAFPPDADSPTANRSTGQSTASQSVSQPSPQRLEVQIMARTKKAAAAATREVSATPGTKIKKKGTGAHDNRLTLSEGNFREPSLRRGSGMVVETPAGIRKSISERKKKGFVNAGGAVSKTQPGVGSGGPRPEPLPPSSTVCLRHLLFLYRTDCYSGSSHDRSLNEGMFLLW